MVQIHGIRRASADAKYRQMTGQPVKPLILKLCLPAVISNLVTTAYNLTDTFFIGQLGTAQSGAIGIAFSIMTVMQALGFFFGNGAGNSMSRELGKQNNDRASRLLAVGFAGAVISGLVIATIGLLTLRPLVVMLGSTSTIAPYAVQYLTPLLVAAPCVCGSFALNGLLRYQGQSAFGMIGLVSGALLNFLLAPLFIFVAASGDFRCRPRHRHLPDGELHDSDHNEPQIRRDETVPAQLQTGYAAHARSGWRRPAFADPPRRRLDFRDLREHCRQSIRRCGHRRHGHRDAHHVGRQFGDRGSRPRLSAGMWLQLRGRPVRASQRRDTGSACGSPPACSWRWQRCCGCSHRNWSRSSVPTQPWWRWAWPRCTSNAAR